jgi:hypothetical protein
MVEFWGRLESDIGKMDDMVGAVDAVDDIGAKVS